MKNNRYYQNRKAIRKLAEEKNVDVGVACAMYRYEQGWNAPEGDKDITKFCQAFSIATDSDDVDALEKFWK